MGFALCERNEFATRTWFARLYGGVTIRDAGSFEKARELIAPLTGHGLARRRQWPLHLATEQG